MLYLIEHGRQMPTDAGGHISQCVRVNQIKAPMPRLPPLVLCNVRFQPHEAYKHVTLSIYQNLSIQNTCMKYD